MNQTAFREQLFITTAPEAAVSALTDRFASRGLVQSVLLGAEEQIASEEKTRELAPRAYRLSLLSDAAVHGMYRRGKDSMSAEDLLRYVEEGLCMERREKDFSDVPSIYETACVMSLEPAESRKGAIEKWKRAPVKLSALPGRTLKTVRERIPLWFNPQRADTSANRRKFPFSAFAAIAAVAVSMMLIVASALMVTNAETQISKLNSEISSLHTEVSDLRSDLESQTDLMAIRQTAIEQYGMVEENFLKMDYITLDTSEMVEIFQSNRSRNVGLSAILSAIGLKK